MKKIMALGLAVAVGIVTAIGGVPLTARAASDTAIVLDGDEEIDLLLGSGPDTRARAIDLYATLATPATTETTVKIEKPSITVGDSSVAAVSVSDYADSLTISATEDISNDGYIGLTFEAKAAGSTNVTLSVSGTIGGTNVSTTKTIKVNVSDIDINTVFTGSSTVTVGDTVNMKATITFTDNDGNAYEIDEDDFYAVDIDYYDKTGSFDADIDVQDITFNGNVVTVPFKFKGVGVGTAKIYISFCVGALDCESDNDEDFTVAVVNSTTTSTTTTSSSTTSTNTATRSTSSSSSSSSSSGTSTSFSDGGARTSGSGSAKASYTRSSSKSVKFETSEVSFKATSAKVPSTVKIGGKSYAVTSIASNAFQAYDKLKMITIGNNIKKIGRGAFAGCTNLKSITINSKKLTANNIKGALKDSAVNTVYVPTSKVNDYKKIFTKKITGSKGKITVKAKKK